jgi:hypothetical protein
MYVRGWKTGKLVLVDQNQLEAAFERAAHHVASIVSGEQKMLVVW